MLVLVWLHATLCSPRRVLYTNRSTDYQVDRGDDLGEKTPMYYDDAAELPIMESRLSLLASSLHNLSSTVFSWRPSPAGCKARLRVTSNTSVVASLSAAQCRWSVGKQFVLVPGGRSVSVAVILRRPSILKNQSTLVYASDTRQLIVRGTGLLPGLRLEFLPALVEGRDYHTTVQSADRVLLELLTHWRSTPGPLRVTSVDTGGGRVPCNTLVANVQADPRGMRTVGLEMQSHVLSIYASHSVLTLPGYGLSDVTQYYFANRELTLDDDYVVKSKTNSWATLELRTGSTWVEPDGYRVVSLKVLAVLKDGQIVPIGVDERKTGVTVASVYPDPHVEAAPANKIYATLTPRFEIRGAFSPSVLSVVLEPAVPTGEVLRFNATSIIVTAREWPLGKLGIASINTGAGQKEFNSVVVATVVPDDTFVRVHRSTVPKLYGSARDIDLIVEGDGFGDALDSFCGGRSNPNDLKFHFEPALATNHVIFVDQENATLRISRVGVSVTQLTELKVTMVTACGRTFRQNQGIERGVVVAKLLKDPDLPQTTSQIYDTRSPRQVKLDLVLEDGRFDSAVLVPLDFPAALRSQDDAGLFLALRPQTASWCARGGQHQKTTIRLVSLSTPYGRLTFEPPAALAVVRPDSNAPLCSSCAALDDDCAQVCRTLPPTKAPTPNPTSTPTSTPFVAGRPTMPVTTLLEPGKSRDFIVRSLPGWDAMVAFFQLGLLVLIIVVAILAKVAHVERKRRDQCGRHVAEEIRHSSAWKPTWRRRRRAGHAVVARKPSRAFYEPLPTTDDTNR